MEDVKRLSIDGKDFTIEDVELRSGPAWANGPRRIDAELPDGQVLGSIVASDGEWALASRRREMEPYGTGRRPHRRIYRP